MKLLIILSLSSLYFCLPRPMGLPELSSAPAKLLSMLKGGGGGSGGG